MLHENEISYGEPFLTFICVFGMEEVMEKINNNLFVTYTVSVPGKIYGIVGKNLLWFIRNETIFRKIRQNIRRTYGKRFQYSKKK